MRSAIDLNTSRPISIKDVTPTYGHATIDGLEADRTFECPFCGRRLHFRAEGHRVSHFAHGPGEACPTSRLAAQAFTALRPRDADPDAAQRLRNACRQSWWHHFVRMRDFIPGFSVDEFIVVLDRSLENRIWNYCGLELWEVPYSLALLADFSPPTAYGWRPAWYRFWVRNEPNDRLWIWPAQRGRLMRGGFTPRPRGGLPTYNDLIALKEIATTPHFLALNVGVPHPYIGGSVNEWFLKHRRSFPM